MPPTGLGSRPPRPPDTLAGLADPDEEPRPRKSVPLDRLLHEYRMYLRRRGRSPRTIRWYEQKIEWYLHNGGVQSLEELTKAEFERYLDELWERKLAPNTIHGCFEAMKAFLNWAARAKYAVDPEALEVEQPAVPEYEIEVYSERQLEAIVQHCPPGWARLAVLILLGTGMRVGEACALTVDDVEEDDEDGVFFKIRRGKGAKFRRAPVSERLARELIRYLNRMRPDAAVPNLLVRSDGRPVTEGTVTELFKAVRRKVGFRVHAHKFRHTFATEYLRNGGDIERLRRILGHRTYVMVMRYVHLNKRDLAHGFDERSPF